MRFVCFGGAFDLGGFFGGFHSVGSFKWLLVVFWCCSGEMEPVWRRFGVVLHFVVVGFGVVFSAASFALVVLSLTRVWQMHQSIVE
jgi:hypothetical protein